MSCKPCSTKSATAPANTAPTLSKPTSGCCSKPISPLPRSPAASRNTPLLVQLFFLYYGLPKLGMKLDQEICAIIGLTFLGGSFMAETLRSGLDAVEPIQLQSSLSLGLTPWQATRRVILPQAVAISMPGITANLVFLVKETSVVSIIALPDLVFRAKEQIGSKYQTAEALLLLVVCYLLILLPVSLGTGFLERRLRRATFGD